MGKAKLPLFFAFTLSIWLMSVPRIGISAGLSSWQKIDEGLESRSLEFNSPQFENTIKIQVLRIDPEKFGVRVIDCRAFGAERMDVKSMARKAQALAVINGGFFLPDHRPLGLLIVNGKEMNPLRNADWGIFLMQDHTPRIIHTKEFSPEISVSQALQVGPRLVVSGRELRLKRQVARRSAVGVTFTNHVVLLSTTDTEAYAQNLARIFQTRESEGGLECREALTLDGGPSAQMYGEYKSLKIDIPGGWPVPNGIGVFKK